MTVLHNAAEIKERCNCRNRNNCPLDGAPNIIYEAQILNQPSYREKIYIRNAETDFEHKFTQINHSSLNTMKTTRNYLKNTGQ